VIWTETSET